MHSTREFFLQEEVTTVCPPLGDPEAVPQEYWLLLRTVYGLHWSPCHWYSTINSILLSIGLTPLFKDPCLYSGFIQDSGTKLAYPLSLGLYVNDFEYFSDDPEVESLFYCLLAQLCEADFVDIVNCFLSIHFSEHVTPSSVTVHLNQSG
jgi:hypothetical protein